jgi:cobalt-zinc-cadmium efflux system membrane fusion protein
MTKRSINREFLAGNDAVWLGPGVHPEGMTESSPRFQPRVSRQTYPRSPEGTADRIPPNRLPISFEHPISFIVAISKIVAAFVIIALLAGCRSHTETTSVPEPKVTADTVTIATNSPQLSAIMVQSATGRPDAIVPLSGRIIWDEDVTVRVFTPFAGIVRKLLADVNRPVRKGAPLAEIQSADFEQAVADARKAETDLRRTDRNLNRLRDLVEHNAAPRKDLEAAEAEYAGAQAEKDRTAARLAMYGAPASADHGFLLPSPLDGILVERNVTPGQEVRPDQMLANMPQFTAPLFIITDPSRLWIQVDATEVDLPHLRPGREFTFTTRAFPGEVFIGRVDVVSESIDPATRTIKVRGTVDNASRSLKAEMFVSVNLPGDETPGTTVPSKAVFLKGDRHYVFVEDSPGQFSRQEVKVGLEQNGRILVMSGVQAGQRVVTDGCILLQQTLHD